MAAYAALLSLLNNIHAVTKHPHLSTSLDNKQIQPLLEKSNFLLDFIEGNTYGRGSKEVQDLERKIAAAAHAAEDLIESHIVDQIYFGKSGANLACSLDLQQSIHEMDAVMGKLMQILEKVGVKKEISTHLAVAEPLKQSGGSGMVGLDADLNQLLDELTDARSRLRVISIVGMGGIGLRSLNSLNIRWPISGGELPTSFPTSLQKLSLSRCELHWDDMEIIGSLPQLEVLKLEDIDALGEGRWSPIHGQFCRLKFLLLKHCRNLVSCDAYDSHFPLLEKLILDGLWRLKEIPLDFGEILALELIDVDFCSISAAISAIIIKEYKLATSDYPLRVEVRVAEWHLDRFNQILEAEGLTIDNIHFKTFHDDTDDETD